MLDGGRRWAVEKNMTARTRLHWAEGGCGWLKLAAGGERRLQLRSAASQLLPQQEFWAWEAPYFKSFFQISRRFWFFLNCPINGAITRPPQLRRTKNKSFSFFAIFDKNTGYRVTKFHPVYRINIAYKFYFIIFSLSRNNFFGLLLDTRFWHHLSEKVG